MGRAGAQMVAQGPSPELVPKVGRLVLLGRILLLVLFVMVVQPGT